MRGEGRLFKRGSRWWIAFWGPQNGKWCEIRESTRSDKEADARKMLKQRLREIANHRDGIRSFQGPKQSRLTVGNLLDSLEADYRRRAIKSLRTALIHMKPVRAFFGHVRAISVTSDLCREYIELRRKQGKSPATVNRECELVGAAYSLALKEDRIARKPHVPTLPEDNTRQNFFEEDQLDRIVKHLPAPLDSIARMAFVAGWRREELRMLTWSAVDRSAREIRLFDSKNSDGRVLPLDDETWTTLIEPLWAARQYQTPSGPSLSEYVFHRNGKPVSDSTFTKQWQRARKAAGLPGVVLHDMRRTACRNMVRAGIAQTTVMAILGHRSDSMFRRYSITTSEDKREALRRQREYLKAQPKKSNVAQFRSPAEPDSDKTRTIRNS